MGGLGETGEVGLGPMQCLAKRVGESGCFNEASAKPSTHFKQRGRIYTLERLLVCNLEKNI